VINRQAPGAEAVAVELVVINLARPWSGEDAADGLAGPLLLAATGRLGLPGGYSVL
jgi:hypothetical protein